MNVNRSCSAATAALCSIAIALMGASGAQAATPIQTVAPDGLTIRLVDYSIGADECTTPASALGQGINRDSNLKFFCSPAMDAGDANVMDRYINRYGDNGDSAGGGTRYTFPANGTAERTLNAAGYPTMRDDTHGALITQDLSYLFDDSAHEGKTVYEVAEANLLHYDGDGQYTFDQDWDADWEPATGSFSVHEAGGWGLFFPFDPPGGDYMTKNHYFGMQITQNFWQPDNGITTAGNPMRFDFVGDDDVWVYVDGVLVLDLGGINTGYGWIDFSTGRVSDHKNGKWEDTTIRELFEKAGVTPDGGFEGDTLASNTAHELRMFYLERGHYASAFRLSYNLQPYSYPLTYELNYGTGTVPGKEDQ